MGYNYKKERAAIFTEEGQEMFLKIRDRVGNLIKLSGGVRMDMAILDCVGSSWEMMACVDRLVELGEIYEVELKNPVPGQYRFFSKA